MADSRRFLNPSRGNVLSMAMLAAGIMWTICHPGNIGARGGFHRSSHAIRPTGCCPAARMTAVSKPPPVLIWTGEARLLAAGNRRMWLDQADRWLREIKARIRRLGGPPPSDRLSCPTAVMAIRAAVLPTATAARSGKPVAGPVG
jgi:hypothetical protein